jgi:hypothetical protein
MTSTIMTPSDHTNLETPARPIEPTIRLLARSLARQAARRHVSRGLSILEVAATLLVGAAILGALLCFGWGHSH